jgi:hypothetical protein
MGGCIAVVDGFCASLGLAVHFLEQVNYLAVPVYGSL